MNANSKALALLITLGAAALSTACQVEVGVSDGKSGSSGSAGSSNEAGGSSGAAGEAGSAGDGGSSGEAGSAGSGNAPSTCQDVHGFVGCCDGDVVYYYEEGKVGSVDCAAAGKKCGWDGTFYNCADAATSEPSGKFPLACGGEDIPSACGSCGDVSPAGKCKDSSTRLVCVTPDSAFEAPHVDEQACPTGWACVDTDDGASCVNPNECVENEARCADEHTLKTCKGGKWVQESCGELTCQATANVPAACGIEAVSEGGVTYPLTGQLWYEYRLPNNNRTGMGPVDTTMAYYVLIGAWKGDEYVGGAITDPDGNFTVNMTLPPGQDTKLYAFPMAFGFDDSQQPLNAVAYPPKLNTEGKNSPGYWTFQYPFAISDNQNTLGNWTVTESEGSAAIWIFQWQQYAFNRMYDRFPGEKMRSVVTFWEPGVEFDCGACFYPFGGSGATVDLGNGQSDFYEGLFQFTGTDETPKHWQSSSIGHEFGHYVMSNYSISPNEGGSHSSSQVSSPGLAYSEGWATFFGQRNMSDETDPQNGLESVYFSVASGTYWYYDLDKIALSNSGVPKANPNGGLDQKISEAIVTYMMWHMWAPSGANPPYKNLGDQPLFGALVSDRTTNKALNRGYTKVDYVDFADGLICNSSSLSAAVLETAAPVKFPYTFGGSCP